MEQTESERWEREEVHDEEEKGEITATDVLIEG